ncbi:MAG: hypothetical protein COB61_003595 [Thiotrichales bacterium]|nr:hypothetical protein [Thiotrichales bacterium]
MLSASCSVEEHAIESRAVSSGSENQIALVEYCGGCHVAPKPETKAAKDWRAVVLRMQVHRSQQAMPVLTELEINEVIKYLMKHSKEQ